MSCADEQLRALIAQVGAFHLTDRSMKRAQADVEAAAAAGRLDDAARRAYLRAVRRYFEAFSREAHAQMRDVDRRLQQVAQVQFNLTAERGVVTKRIEATSDVLARASSLDGERLE
jgi:imidazolonepropionase-like amidohydrolase